LFYRKWLGAYIFPTGACVIFINMALIIHSVLAQKKKSDQNRLGAANDSNSACGSRISGHFLRVASCLGNLFTPLKWCVGCGENSTSNKDAQTLALNIGNATRTTQQDNISSGCAKSAVIENNDPFPFLKVSFGPAEILTSPTLNQNKSSQVKNNEEGNEENGLVSSDTSKPRAPPSRSGTGTDPYKFNTAKVRASIKREDSLKSLSQLPAQDEDLEDLNTLFALAVSKPRAPPSRTGTGTDPYKFNAAKVRERIRRESKIALEEDMTAAAVTGQSEADSGHNDEDRRASNNTNNSSSSSSVERSDFSSTALYGLLLSHLYFPSDFKSYQFARKGSSIYYPISSTFLLALARFL